MKQNSMFFFVTVSAFPAEFCASPHFAKVPQFYLRSLHVKKTSFTSFQGPSSRTWTLMPSDINKLHTSKHTVGFQPKFNPGAPRGHISP